MSVYYGYSSYGLPNVVAQYVCRCGRLHMQPGPLQVRKLPPGWHQTADASGQPEPECAECHEATVARRAAST